LRCVLPTFLMAGIDVGLMRRFAFEQGLGKRLVHSSMFGVGVKQTSTFGVVMSAFDPKVDMRRSALRFISYGKFENVT
jgi:hypothetical protein